MSFKHKGLRLLYERGDRRRLDASLVEKINAVLADLDTASTVSEMDLPGYRLHALKGDREGDWSITVRATWRITFRFQGNDAFDVDLEDYH